MNQNSTSSPYPPVEDGRLSQTPFYPRRFEVKLPQITPIVTYILLAVTGWVYLLQLATQNLVGFDLAAAFGMKANDLIAQGQFWRLITPVFLHASLLHLGFNMYALYVLGPGLERHFGHGRFLALYFLSGFAGNVISFIFSASYSLGASTAVFGLLSAQAVFLYRNRKVFGGFARRALYNIIFIAAVNLMIGISPGIDNWGHLGGLIGGTLFAWFGGPLLNFEGLYPNVFVVDERRSGVIALAVVAVGALFVFFAALTLYFRY